MLGALAGIGKSLLGELLGKGVQTIGNVARKALDTYIPRQGQGEFQGNPSTSMVVEYQGAQAPSSENEFEGNPNLPTRSTNVTHKIFGQRLDRLESGIDKLRKRIRK